LWDLSAKASVYEIKENDDEVAFIIRFGTKESIAAYNERAERAEASFACAEPCRGLVSDHQQA
jgi:hypothetical protein